MPTNALLGFANMLFKLLSDYRPRGVAVAWDTRPTHRTRGRRGGRRRLQGGPPADAGPAPRAVPALPADRRGVRLREPRVRGLGGRRRHRHARDARRRGGSEDVRRLDRPRRLPALLGERDADDDAARRRRTSTSTRPSASSCATASAPTRCRTSSASRATPRTTSRASRASATRRPDSWSRSTARWRRSSRTPTSSRPRAGKAVREHADQARASKELATMRRDLPLDVDPTTLVSGAPDRSQMKEIFRRFEFRGLLGRVDELDAAVPAQERPKLEGQAVAVARGAARAIRDGSASRSRTAASRSRRRRSARRGLGAGQRVAAARRRLVAARREVAPPPVRARPTTRCSPPT